MLTQRQAAYVFDPDDEAPNDRPSKRRRVSKKRLSASKGDGLASESLFVALMDGKERDDCVKLRGRLFEECWSRVEARIKVWDEPRKCLLTGRMLCADRRPAEATTSKQGDTGWCRVLLPRCTVQLVCSLPPT